MVGENYFSKDYFEARDKFVRATTKLKCESFKVRSNLTIDCALSEAKSKDTLIIFESGVHGVEGYLGSAFQLSLIDKSLKKFNSKFSVAFIHSLNPVGFSKNRRYNENNVDLNRNCLGDFSIIKQMDPMSNLIMEESQPIITPKRPRIYDSYEYISYYFLLVRMILRRGFSETIKAAAFGQNTYPTSVCYCGRKKEKSILFFERYIKKITKGYKNAIFIDLHSGTGKKYDLNGFTTSLSDSSEFEFFSDLVFNLKDLNNTSNEGVDHLEGLCERFLQISNAKKNSEMTVEFGTAGRTSIIFSLSYLARILISENQTKHYGPKRRMDEISRKFKSAYFPDTEKYRKFILDCADRFSEKLLEKF